MQNVFPLLLSFLLCGCYTGQLLDRVDRVPREHNPAYSEAPKFDIRTAARRVPLTTKVDPCSDSLYVALKIKPIDDMTEREYEYFTRKDQECADYQKAQMELEPESRKADALQEGVGAYKAYLIIGGVAILASTMYIMTLDYDY